MTHPFLAVPLLFLLGVLPATAQTHVGGYLAWDLPEFLGGTDTKTFECDTNDGADELVLAFEPDADLDDVTALHARVFIHWKRFVWPPPDPPLVEYWRMQPGGCREGAYSVSTDFSGEPFHSISDVEDVVHGRTALASFTWPFDPRSEYGVLTVEVRLALPVVLSKGQLYYLCRLALPHVKSTGTGACLGCCEEVAFGVTAAVSQTRGGWAWPAYDVPPLVAFRGPRYESACYLTPVRTRTWGEIKTLYR